MGTKDIFETTAEMLIEDANLLQKKFRKMQENNDFRGAIDCMRLLKDCLALIKEYDWKLRYSEYKTGEGDSLVAIWEQNHCDEIKNHKIWNVKSSNTFNSNIWYEIFKNYIDSGKSHIIDYGDKYRNTGKSFAIKQLCNDYNGAIVSNNGKVICLINNSKSSYLLGASTISYQDYQLKQYENFIFFIDENSKLSSEQIENLCKNHIVIGFQ